MSISLEKGLTVKKKLERLDNIWVNLYKVYNELIQQKAEAPVLKQTRHVVDAVEMQLKFEEIRLKGEKRLAVPQSAIYRDEEQENSANTLPTYKPFNGFKYDGNVDKQAQYWWQVEERNMFTENLDFR